MAVYAQQKLEAGDMLEIVGLPQEVELAGPSIGIVEKPTNVTDMVFVGLCIAIGALIGAITLTVKDVPISSPRRAVRLSPVCSSVGCARNIPRRESFRVRRCG